MRRLNSRKRWPAAAAAVIAAAAAGALAACGGPSPNSGTTTGAGGQTGAAAIAAALNKPTTLTFWGWAPQNKDIVAAFEKKYPKVKVNLVNAGTSTDEYTKLENAIKAGSGAPDVTQIEYYALPQFALQKDLADLGSLGLSGDKSQFSTAVWDSVNLNGHLDGLPQDTGPMALFYNKKVFGKYHLTVPSTWAQFAADAKKLHAANPKEYLTSDIGDPGFVTSMIWAAGGHPYTTSGAKNVTIDFSDAGSKKFTSLWSPLVSGGLLDSVKPWTSAWFQGLANGTIASLPTGAWMPVDLETSVPGGKGDWRVAPLPQWTAGQDTTAENGGSANCVLAQSQHQLAAAGFVQFMSTAEGGAQISAKDGDFPAANSILNSPEYLGQAPAYFGGQKINQVLAKAAGHVLPGWNYLPFQVYANSIFPDTVGQAYTGKSTLAAGLRAWEQRSAAYGNSEGFSVTSK